MKKLIYIFLTLFIVFSCKHRDDEFDGPDLNDLNGPFYVIEPLFLNSKTIDFINNEVLEFNAELSKNTSWVISIKGVTSGAIATVEGNDRVVSSEIATWNGSADVFPSFLVEDAIVTMTFPDEENSPIYTDTISILSEKIDKGSLITSFETGFGDSWSRFNQTTVAGKIICSDGNAAKGDCHYSISGTVGWDWAIGSVAINADDGNFGLQNNSNNLFFNLALRPIENVGPQSSFIQVWFDEDENEDGVFDPTTEDRYIYEYWTENDSWKILSIKYADIQFDAEGNNVEVFGNGLPEPSKLSSINVFFLANPDNGNAKILLDHMIFTTNSPYKP